MTDGATAGTGKGTAPPDPLIGRVVSGRFKVLSLLARGGYITGAFLAALLKK